VKTAATVVYEFGSFRMDPAERLLLKDGQPVPLTPKAFDLLVYLAERPGRLVEKQALMSALWPDAVVEETNLAYNVSALRKALGDGHEAEHVIQTVPTRGYRFIAPIRERSTDDSAPTAGLRPWHALLAAGLAAGALVAAFLLWHWSRSEPPANQVVRFELPSISVEDITPPAISPDGSRIVYSARQGARRQLHLRALNSLQVTALLGTIGAEHPFFSPDGRAIGFATPDNILMTIDLATSQLSRVCPTAGTAGATWGSDGRIYYGAIAGLFAVRASGGVPEALADTKAGESIHGWPELLPDGRHLLFSVWRIDDLDHARVDALSLDTGARQTILEGVVGARYLATGHLAYVRQSSLFVVSFDPRTLRMQGTPVPVLDGVGIGVDAAPYYAVSATGTLAYHPGSLIQDWTEMVWVSAGAEERIAAPSGYYTDPNLSPDDRRLAASPNYGVHQDIWVHDFAHETWTRLTTHAGFAAAPVWHPSDPSRIVFTTVQPGGGGPDLFSMPADASGPAELLYASPYAKYPTSSAPGSGLLAFVEVRPETEGDIWLLDLHGKPAARPVVQTPRWDGSPALSPDGRWLAYESQESGRMEVYVRPVSGPAGRWVVSPDGGNRPRWSRDGRRIVYRSGRRMMAVNVISGTTFAAERPEVLFEGTFTIGGVAPNYDITADGRRLLLIKPAAEQPRFPLVVVQNWFSELQQKIGR
jgi:eukaryotic-like serine/threonine-protein kinase